MLLQTNKLFFGKNNKRIIQAMLTDVAVHIHYELKMSYELFPNKLSIYSGSYYFVRIIHSCYVRNDSSSSKSICSQNDPILNI